METSGLCNQIKKCNWIQTISENSQCFVAVVILGVIELIVEQVWKLNENLDIKNSTYKTNLRNYKTLL